MLLRDEDYKPIYLSAKSLREVVLTTPRWKGYSPLSTLIGGSNLTSRESNKVLHWIPPKESAPKFLGVEQTGCVSKIPQHLKHRLWT